MSLSLDAKLLRLDAHNLRANWADTHEKYTALVYENHRPLAARKRVERVEPMADMFNKLIGLMRELEELIEEEQA